MEGRALTTYWWCMVCHLHGEGDRQAETHTKATSHPTMTSIHPPATSHGGNEVASD